ncbi:MAG: SBBP repeat-containing protein [Bacteroidia bacterium]|nr:SBBP repeat-containing protein [Bacteroidia bacterium]
MIKRVFLFCFTLFLGQASAQNLMWAGLFGGTSPSAEVIVTAVASDLTGNVYSTGTYAAMNDFDPGPGAAFLNTFGATYDIFVSKLDLGGSYVWAKRIGKFTGIGSNSGQAICTDASGNVYVAGYFSDGVEFDPDITNQFLMTSFGSTDAFILKLDPSGNFIWARQIGGSLSDDITGISVDASGNIYTIGNFTGSADFDPGVGTFVLTSGGITDIFISKLDMLGNFVWAKRIGGTQQDFATSLYLDASSNVYIGGSFYSTVDFDPGPGTYTMAVGTSTANNLHITKIDNNGNFLWAKQIEGNGSKRLSALKMDVLGNVHVAGSFVGSADFDPSLSSYSISAVGSSDIFVAKYDNSGNFIWVKQMSGSAGEEAYGLAINAAGEVFTTGTFWTTVDFDPGPGTYPFSSGTGQNCFISRLNSSGNFVSAKSIGGTGDQYGTSLTFDAYGSLIMGGYLNAGSVIDFDPGPGTYTINPIGNVNGFVAKFDDCTLPATLTAVFSNTLVCSGQTISISTSGASTYTLYPGATTGANQTATVSGNSLFTIAGTNSAGCMDAQTVSVSVHPDPVVYSSSSVTCSGQSVDIKVFGAMTHTWNTSSTSFSITVAPGVTTTYTVSGTSSSGCSYAVAFTQSVSTCTNLQNKEMKDNEAIRCFPNPNSGSFSIKATQNVSFDIINELGQKIITNSLDESNHQQIVIEGLAPGVYFIIVPISNGYIRQKIIVIR